MASFDLEPLRRHVVTLTGVRNKKVAKFFAAVNIVLTIHNHYLRLQRWLKGRSTYTVSVSTKERIFNDVQEWVIPLIPETQQKNVSVISMANGLGLAPENEEARKFSYEGHEYEVSQFSPGRRGYDDDDGYPKVNYHAADYDVKLYFTCYSKAAQDALIAKFAEIRESQNVREKRKPILSILSTWNSHGKALPKRPIESVVLADGQKERIIADMEKFLASEDDYLRMGIPWHRGYLFEGPPGTGKSSLAKALASHFGLDLYYFPLSSASSDTNLATSVQNVSQHSILLLEDIDVFSAVKSREEQKGSNALTMSGLLNVLDGVMTPHGLIIIMTTNDKGVLDPAVYRPGRVDLDEHIGELVPGQGERMFEACYGRPPKAPLGVEGLVPARLMDIFKLHINKPAKAEAAIAAMVKAGQTEYTKTNYDDPRVFDSPFEDSDLDDDDEEVVSAAFVAAKRLRESTVFQASGGYVL